MDVKHDYSTTGDAPDPTLLTEVQLLQKVQQLEAVISTLSASHSLEALIHSSWDLLDRFEATPTPKKALDRFGSEVFEFVTAVNEAWGGNGMEHAHAAKELADVMVSALNVARSLHLPRLLILTTVVDVMAENDAKNEGPR